MPTHISSSTSALIDIGAAIGFWLLLTSPLIFGPFGVKTAVIAVMAEFFFLHARGIIFCITNLGFTSRTRYLSIAGLAAAYFLFLWAYVWTSFHQWAPFIAMGGLFAGRLIPTSRSREAGFDDPFGDPSLLDILGIVGSVLAYFGCLILILTVNIPPMGLDAALLPQLDLEDLSWSDEPHRPLAFGVVYYGMHALVKSLVALFKS